MFSNRIKLIASLLDKNDRVLDVGTDHGLLPIYLIKNNLVEAADGSDVSDIILSNARSNVEKFHYEDKINIILSDGLKSIDVANYNTLVVAGMGFSTIKNILCSNSIDSIYKMIIQTNNDYEAARRFINHVGYRIIKEICIKDKNINYIIFQAVKENQTLSDDEYLCGIYSADNKWYYEEMILKIDNVLKSIPSEHHEKIKQLNKEKKIYRKYISTGKTEEKNS